MFIMVIGNCFWLFLRFMDVQSSLSLSLSHPPMEDAWEVAIGFQDVISQYPVVLQDQIK